MPAPDRFQELCAPPQRRTTIRHGSENGPVRNQILAALPPADLRRLLPRLESVHLRLNQVVYHENEPIRYVYFPQDALMSVVASMREGKSVEVNLIGPEGVLGVRAVLGSNSYPHSAVVQISGSCLRVQSETFINEFLRCGALHAQTLRYLRYLLAQISQNAACNRVHRVKQRLARRLLMIQDRVKNPAFPITHEALSNMLGTPRSDVSVAAEALRKSGVIDYARGRISILDRRKLESASCECYGVIHNELLRLNSSSA